MNCNRNRDDTLVEILASENLNSIPCRLHGLLPRVAHGIGLVVSSWFDFLCCVQDRNPSGRTLRSDGVDYGAVRLHELFVVGQLFG